MHVSPIDFGDPVVVLRGAHQGRIGVYEDDQYRGNRKVAIVKFGNPFITPEEHHIAISSLARPDTGMLLRRLDALLWRVHAFQPIETPMARMVDLQEYYLIEAILHGRYQAAMRKDSVQGKLIFLSHSTKDKWFVNRLAADLADLGHRVWIDEWEINVGDSIPTRIAEGLESADFVAVVLTQHSVESKWVEREWQAKYWSEIEKNQTAVLPLLVEDCVIPLLLKTRRYADFRTDYSSALKNVAIAVAGSQANNGGT